MMNLKGSEKDMGNRKRDDGSGSDEEGNSGGAKDMIKPS